MKRVITLIALVLVSASTLMYAQSKSETRRAERKAQREAEKAREKAENERAYAIAVQALQKGEFVLEADQLVFKRGRSAYVSPTTNFVMMNGNQQCHCRSQRNWWNYRGRYYKRIEDNYRQEGKLELQFQCTRCRYIGTSIHHTYKWWQQCNGQNQPQLQFEYFNTKRSFGSTIRIECI